jgi:hypothetical protein
MAPAALPSSPPRRDPEQVAEPVEGDAQAVGDDRVGAPWRDDFRHEDAAVAHAPALDDGARQDRQAASPARSSAALSLSRA